MQELALLQPRGRRIKQLILILLGSFGMAMIQNLKHQTRAFRTCTCSTTGKHTCVSRACCDGCCPDRAISLAPLRAAPQQLLSARFRKQESLVADGAVLVVAGERVKNARRFSYPEGTTFSLPLACPTKPRLHATAASAWPDAHTAMVFSTGLAAVSSVVTAPTAAFSGKTQIPMILPLLKHVASSGQTSSEMHSNAQYLWPA